MSSLGSLSKSKIGYKYPSVSSSFAQSEPTKANGLRSCAMNVASRSLDLASTISKTLTHTAGAAAPKTSMSIGISEDASDHLN